MSNDGMEQVRLCRPCAEALGEVRKVIAIPSLSQKETCTECGRRRYCCEYQVGKLITYSQEEIYD